MTTKNSISQCFAAAMVLAATALSTPIALAHGTPDSKHGGVVQIASHITFELVTTPDGALIYALDHDKEMDVARFSGKLTVLNGTEKSETALKPAGGNRLEAKGIKLSPGAKAVAVLNSENKKTITVRFMVKK